MNLKYEHVEGEVTSRLMSALSRGNDLRGYLDRVVFGQYCEAQIKRFETEGASEGAKWRALDSKYEAYKKRKFASYPYGGRRIGVGYGNLLKVSVGKDSEIVTDTHQTGKNAGKKYEKKRSTIVKHSGLKSGKYFYKIATPRSLVVYLTLPYAEYFDEERSISHWSRATMDNIENGVMNYVMGGVR